MTAALPASGDTRLEQLPEDHCRVLLGMATVGRIAFVVDGLPTVLPVNYQWLSDESEPSILLRARPGHAIDRAPEEVAFEIDGSLVNSSPAYRADHDNQHGWSVLVRGVLHELDPDEIERLEERFNPEPWPRPRDHTSWLAIRPRTIAGCRLPPGAREWVFPSEALERYRPGSQSTAGAGRTG